LKAIPAELLAHARARARAPLPGRAARARRGGLAGAASCGRAGCAATAVLVPPARRHRGQSTSAERHSMQPPLGPRAAGEQSKCRVGWGHGHVQPPRAQQVPCTVSSRLGPRSCQPSSDQHAQCKVRASTRHAAAEGRSQNASIHAISFPYLVFVCCGATMVRAILVLAITQAQLLCRPWR